VLERDSAKPHPTTRSAKHKPPTDEAEAKHEYNAAVALRLRATTAYSKAQTVLQRLDPQVAPSFRAIYGSAAQQEGRETVGKAALKRKAR
jgi:hypothetical protein